AADRYVIDGRSSRFTAQAFATGMLARMGHNPTIGIRDLGGEMDFNPDKLEVLETAKFPEIVYDAPGISVTKMADALYSAALDGKLTLHGVTRNQPITVRVALFGSMLRASGDFSLDQTDYNIKLVSVAGGALKLKDELKFSFEIVARKQQ